MNSNHPFVAAIQEAQEEGPIRTLDFLSGFSGEKLLGTLQRLVKVACVDQEHAYVEIGVFQGLSLLSVATANPEVPCFGIDNFAFFDADGTNKALVEERREIAGASNAELINKDYEDALESLEDHLQGRKIGVYFVDGPHDYRSQLVCLLLAKPYLAENAVIVIDDSNYDHVRQANRDFLVSHPEFKLLFESYTPEHPLNAGPEGESAARAGWWDGVNILVRDPEDRFATLLPPTRRDRTLYENEHIVHPMRYAALAPRAVALLTLLHPLRPLKLVRRLKKLRASLKGGELPGAKFGHGNTYSEGLPERLNSGPGHGSGH